MTQRAYTLNMRILTTKTLREYWTKHPNAKAPLTEWVTLVKAQKWTGPQDIANIFSSADFLANNRVIFNIGENNHRLIVKIEYRLAMIFILFVGTHAEYDKIDASKL